ELSLLEIVPQFTVISRARVLTLINDKHPSKPEHSRELHAWLEFVKNSLSHATSLRFTTLISLYGFAFSFFKT
ncbi:hypothetical protein HAX54_003056, partial [Datura stramonium]|nr:hypothetical protein [Datura stramonium]